MQLEQALGQIDGLLDLITPMLTEASPDAIAQAMEQLRDSMTAFAGLAQRFEASAFTPQAVTHMQRISERLAQIREYIVKIGAISNQQLQALVPQQGSTHTYGGSKLPPGAAASVARLYHVSG
ncbi:hypothetical protein ACFO3A_07160 [Comamonas nitrativorans]|uniref:Flagellar protein FlgN n=1 Tax=Comamonas nitrativorans TaxID=108437 RepID=A0ABV9GXN2_9BURK